MSSDVVIHVNQIYKKFEPFKGLRSIFSDLTFRSFSTKDQNVEVDTSDYILKNVSFEVSRGDTIGIVGKNGCGKSTLLQVICGTLAPSSGLVKINGKLAALLELGSGFNYEFTGLENIYLYAAIYGLSKSEVERKLESILEFADIGNYISKPVKVYSSGMVVRLAFAVIAHLDVQILVIDEALSVGDAFFVQKCMRFLREFMRRGTVLFVSHDTSAVLNLCNKAIYMERGQIVTIGEPELVVREYLKGLYSDVSSIPNESKDNHSHVNNLCEKPDYVRDMRQDFIDNSNLRNDLEIFPFNIESDSFGTGGAEILNVVFQDDSNNSVAWAVGGHKVSLIISFIAHKDLNGYIVGFQFKDRLGQVIFGDNTFLAYFDNPLSVNKSEKRKVKFDFIMPTLPIGEYTVSCAIAEGTQSDHSMLHWIHDALVLNSHTSSVAYGLVQVPIISMDVQPV